MFEIDHNKLTYDDEATWDLICSGETIGVFQLESRVGRKHAKLIQPRSIEELSAVIALIRPGCLASKLDDGKSLTEHYIARKQNKEPVTYVHPALEPILRDTEGIATYQEQIIEIGRKLAGMSASDADIYLRYAIGKKKASLIEEGKAVFLAGCSENGIPEKDAELIFSWIQASSRYSFNKCIDPSSVVYTKDGEKLLDEVEVGDYVLAPTSDLKSDEYVEVLDIIDCGDKEVYEVEFENGDIITCTLDHELLCFDGVKRRLEEIITDNLQVITHNQKGGIQVKSFNKLGIIKTKDIEVDSKLHCYYANNVAVSNSHSVVYAQHAYVSAYAKTHFPQEFFCEYLKQAKHRGFKKEEEKRLLVQDARRNGLAVYTYDPRHDNKEYQIIDGQIRAGFIDVKGCGSKDYDKWQEWKQTNTVPDTWDEFLIYCTPVLGKSSTEALIRAGSLDRYKLTRKKMLYQYGVYKRLNDRQRGFVEEHYYGSLEATLVAAIGLGTGKDKPSYNKTSLAKLEASLKDWKSEAYNTWTNAREIEYMEIDTLGAPLSCSRLDDSEESYRASITCMELADAPASYKVVHTLFCYLTDVRVIKTKKKQDMAFIGFSDGMMDLEGVVFPDQYELFKYDLIPDMEVILVGKKNEQGSFVVEKVIEV